MSRVYQFPHANMPRSETICPRSIRYTAKVLFSFPITYILLIGALYNLPFSKIWHVFFNIYYLLHSLIAVFTAWSMYRMKPYAWHVFLAHAFLLTIEQFYLAYYQAENYHVGIPLLFALSLIAVLVLFIKAELRVPYFNPKIAWWESDPRYKISVPVHLTAQDHFFDGDIMDISATGCFIKTKAPLRAEDVVNVQFSLFDRQFTCAGKIVWRTESAVTHPKGVGVKFLNLPKKIQSELKVTVKKLKKLSSNFQRQRRMERVSYFEQKIDSMLSEKKNVR